MQKVALKLSAGELRIAILRKDSVVVFNSKFYTALYILTKERPWVIWICISIWF